MSLLWAKICEFSPRQHPQPTRSVGNLHYKLQEDTTVTVVRGHGLCWGHCCFDIQYPDEERGLMDTTSLDTQLSATIHDTRAVLLCGYLVTVESWSGQV